MEKTFLLGVGGHKCGTTWLHDYLSKSPQTKMGMFKEYHVFDALTQSGETGFYQRRIKEVQEALATPGFRFEHDPKLWKRLTFLADTDEYFDYFAGLLSTAPRVRLTGDITPSYSGLSVETLKMIRHKLKARGLRVRVIFLMRDPLERCWSAVRMDRRETLRAKPDHVFRRSEAAALKRLVANANFVMRTRYDNTITALEQVFAPEEILYGFYETLFDPAEVARICAFLGIDMHPPEFEVRKNVSPKSEGLDAKAERAVVDSYREAYDFIADRFGADRMAALWRSYALLYRGRASGGVTPVV